MSRTRTSGTSDKKLETSRIAGAHVHLIAQLLHMGKCCMGRPANVWLPEPKKEPKCTVQWLTVSFSSTGL
jgi:hypothetical protein